jgi:hypothetical protein
MFIVVIKNGGNDYFLRSTIWAFALERAQQFATREEAAEALQKAKPFTKAKLFKTAQILEGNKVGAFFML